jgi:carbon storage regulator CsrA
MLVLSRKVGERIHVGDNIVLEIRRIAGNRVTLALDAPRNVRILRGELEGPAREFNAPVSEPMEPGRSEATEITVDASSVSILHTLPGEPVERHFVS